MKLNFSLKSSMLTGLTTVSLLFPMMFQSANAFHHPHPPSPPQPQPPPPTSQPTCYNSVSISFTIENDTSGPITYYLADNNNAQLGSLYTLQPNDVSSNSATPTLASTYNGVCSYNFVNVIYTAGSGQATGTVNLQSTQYHFFYSPDGSLIYFGSM